MSFFFYSMQMDELEAEYCSRYDYYNEAYGATARDAADFAESDARAEAAEYDEECRERGIYDAHVDEWHIHEALRAADDYANSDVPF